MKQLLVRQGQVVVEEVPAPKVEPGTVLVRAIYSCISVGTEMSTIQASDLPLWKRAQRQPEKVKKVLEMISRYGPAQTLDQVRGQLKSGVPIGYSAAGVVIEIGDGITDIAVRDRVACAGAQCAHHAEIIRVPRNLTVPIPTGLEDDAASTVALGAIALQAVRRAQPTLGETFVVIGLGILGQLTTQLLKINGCRVIGIDIDPPRISLAKGLGLDVGFSPADGPEIDQVYRLTDGIGADGVIVTAATASNEVISSAFNMCRKKGRVVLVGDVGLHINRKDIYEKELDFFISTSYGPGRYDRNFEEGGLDYPVGYVRWTEGRNMCEYLRLAAEGKLKVAPLLSATYPVDEAPAAYERLKNGRDKPLMVLLSYGDLADRQGSSRVVANPKAHALASGRVRIAIVGAGAFAKTVHLPLLSLLADRYQIQAVMSRTGHVASEAAKRFGANYATTDFETVLLDRDVDAVLIATRHILHTEMTLAALRAGKHVFVEKPLALSRGDLERIISYYSGSADNGGVPLLMTGFNRRFSPYLQRIRELVQTRSNPMILNYRMNAGYIPLDHWVHTREGGGRNLGEACHIYDLFTFLTGSRVLSVEAMAIKPRTAHYISTDNFVATLKFEDGSVATLTYTALGTHEYPKELFEVYSDGKVIILEDYRRLNVMGAKVKGIITRNQEKGHKEELESFEYALRKGGEWPIPLWQQVQATLISFLVEEKINGMKTGEAGQLMESST